MSRLEEVRMLRGTALRLLPGVWLARNQLDLAIDVLECSMWDVEHELTTGQVGPHPINPQVATDLAVMQALISAFTRLHPPQG